MPTWNGTTFYILAEEQDNTLKIPLLMPEDFGVVRTKIPYANMEHIQLTGRGNERFTIKCELYSRADFLTIKATCGNGLSYTVTNMFRDGYDVQNLMLVELRNVWKVSFDEEYHFDMVLEHVVTP